MLFIRAVKQRLSELILRSTTLPPSIPLNWPSEGQKADQGHNYGTGTLLGQSVGSELLLQSLNEAPGPASPAATLISAPCKRLRDNPPDFQGKDVHSPRPRQSSQWLPLLRVFAVLLHACCGLNQNYSPPSHLCCPYCPSLLGALANQHP